MFSKYVEANENVFDRLRINLTKTGFHLMCIKFIGACCGFEKSEAHKEYVYALLGRQFVNELRNKYSKCA